jgi:hypothetical protein
VIKSFMKYLVSQELAAFRHFYATKLLWETGNMALV